MHRKILVLSILAALVMLGFSYDSQKSSNAVSTPAALAPSQQVGLVLNIDPATGAIVEEPVPGATRLAIPTALSERWSTSDEGLLEMPNPSGGKGVYVNLQGRFENGMVGTIDADGKLVAPCAQGLNTAAGHPASGKWGGAP
jgi:hypothetical protein